MSEMTLAGLLKRLETDPPRGLLMASIDEKGTISIDSFQLSVMHISMIAAILLRMATRGSEQVSVTEAQ